MPPELQEALDHAPPDPLGNRWARAWRDGRRYVAVLWADGRLAVESKWVQDGHRLANRLPAPPAGLSWRPLRVEGPWPGV